MSWENSELLFVEEKHQNPFIMSDCNSVSTNEGEEFKSQVQLSKFTDPAKDNHRQNLLNIAENFANLLANNNKEEIDRTLLSEDCQVFVLNFDSDVSMRSSNKLGEGLTNVYPDVKIIEREVLERNVDTQQDTVVHICKSLVWIKNQEANHAGESASEGSLIVKFSLDIFSIKDHKIYKYRTFFGELTESHNLDILTMSKKEKMLARIKELNYTLCGTPDFSKFAALLDEATEYKICGWDQQKVLTAHKDNLTETFNYLQETLEITKVVPYDFNPSGSKVQANYVYYLQEKNINKKNSHKYIWITNCVYLFDENLKIDRVMQLGELVSEEDAEIPFEPFSKEDLENTVKSFFREAKLNLDMFYENRVNLECTFCHFGPMNKDQQNFNGTGRVNALLMQHMNRQDYLFKLIKMQDIYIDQQDTSYESAVYIACGEIWVNKKEIRHQEINLSNYVASENNKEVKPENNQDLKLIRNIRVGKLYFENGKCSKVLTFVTRVSGDSPSL